VRALSSPLGCAGGGSAQLTDGVRCFSFSLVQRRPALEANVAAAAGATPEEAAEAGTSHAASAELLDIQVCLRASPCVRAPTCSHALRASVCA
jgi:hypothetical protein